MRTGLGLVVLLMMLFIGIQGVAFADGLELQCTNRPCHYSIRGGGVELSFGTAAFECESIRGAGAFTTRTSGYATLTFQACREEVTVFRFSCEDLRRQSLKVETNRVGSGFLTEGRLPEMLLTSMRLHLVCGGVQRLDLEGYLVALLDQDYCQHQAVSYSMPFELIAHGRQRSGPLYDVYVDGHGLEEYGIASPWRLTFREPVTMEC